MIEKTDTSKIAKAVADEIELRNSHKEAELHNLKPSQAQDRGIHHRRPSKAPHQRG